MYVNLTWKTHPSPILELSHLFFFVWIKNALWIFIPLQNLGLTRFFTPNTIQNKLKGMPLLNIVKKKWNFFISLCIFTIWKSLKTSTYKKTCSILKLKKKKNQSINGVFDHILQPYTTYFNNHLNTNNVVFITIGLFLS